MAVFWVENSLPTYLCFISCSLAVVELVDLVFDVSLFVGGVCWQWREWDHQDRASVQPATIYDRHTISGKCHSQTFHLFQSNYVICVSQTVNFMGTEVQRCIYKWHFCVQRGLVTDDNRPLVCPISASLWTLRLRRGLWIGQTQNIKHGNTGR